MSDSLRSVLPLLKEYTEKLHHLDTEEVNWLRPAATRLAQFVSQRISTLGDDILRLELELRLAEFEAALRNAGLPKQGNR